MRADDVAPDEAKPCQYCHGSLEVPSDTFGEFEGCPSCVLDGTDTFVTLLSFRVAENEHEPMTVFCCRCPWDVAFWITTDHRLSDTVEEHVRRHHRGAPGPCRPDGTPVWVEDSDWWLVTDEDLAVLRGAGGAR